MKSFFTSLLLAVLCSTSAYTQVGISALPFMEVSNIAQSEALAGADVADWNSVSGLHLNPALLGGEQSVLFSTPFYFDNGFNFGTNWLPLFESGMKIQTPFIVANFEGYSIGFKHKKFTFGRGLLAAPMGSSDHYDSEEVSNSLMTSIEVNNNLKVGIGFNWFKSDIYNRFQVGNTQRRVTKGRSFDIGFVGRSSFENDAFLFQPTYAVSVTDIGRPVNYGFGDEDPLPTTFRAGVGLGIQSKEKISGNSIFELDLFGALSKLMVGYDEEGKPYGPVEAMFKTWKPYEYYNGFEGEELSVRQQLRSHLGVELSFLEIIHVRFGRYYEHEFNGDRYYASSGIGLHYKFISLDYTRIVDNNNPAFLDMEFYQISTIIPLD